jgi:DNA-binding NarL/FixJ family response regulator
MPLHVPCPLTDDEIALLQRYADGERALAICAAMAISYRSLKRRNHSIRAKLAVQSKAQAVVMAWRRGWIS